MREIILIQKILVLYKGKYKGLFSFVLMFEKLSPKTKKCERKCQTFLDFESSLLKYKKFFKLGTRKFNFLK